MDKPILLKKKVERRGLTWLHLYRCECGNEFICRPGSIASGTTKSCGCLAKKILIERNKTKKNTKHGHSGHSTFTPTYGSWRSMIQRATNPNYPAFHRYGGRGITVCDSWRIFESFLADMGERPEGKTLERIDNSKGYEADNCRWATPKEQAANRRAPPKRKK